MHAILRRWPQTAYPWLECVGAIHGLIQNRANVSHNGQGRRVAGRPRQDIGGFGESLCMSCVDGAGDRNAPERV